MYPKVTTGKVTVTCGAGEISMAFRKPKNRFAQPHISFHESRVIGWAAMSSPGESIILGTNRSGHLIHWEMKQFIKNAHMETANQTEIRLFEPVTLYWIERHSSPGWSGQERYEIVF